MAGQSVELKRKMPRVPEDDLATGGAGGACAAGALVGAAGGGEGDGVGVGDGDGTGDDVRVAAEIGGVAGPAWAKALFGGLPANRPPIVATATSDPTARAPSKSTGINQCRGIGVANLFCLTARTHLRSLARMPNILRESCRWSQSRHSELGFRLVHECARNPGARSGRRLHDAGGRKSLDQGTQDRLRHRLRRSTPRAEGS